MSFHRIYDLVFLVAALVTVACQPVQDNSSKPPVASMASNDPPSTTPTPDVTANPPAANFDMSLASIGTHTRSVAADRVTEALLSQFPEKGRYESSQEYNRRLSDPNNKVLFEAVELSGTFAFPVTAYATSVSYDPDREELSWKLLPQSDSLWKNYDLIEVARQSVSGSAYDGYSDFFLKEHFTKITHTKNVYLKIAGLKGLTYITGKASVPRGEASSTERRLKLILIGKLRPPYAFRSRMFPRRGETNMEHREVIEFSLTEVWAIDPVSGKLLSKTHKRERIG